MAKPREPSDVVKNRVLDVSTELFAKYGVDGVSIRKIANETGINHALIIRYFGSKNGLVTEILRRTVSALTGAYPLKPGKSTSEMLEELRKTLLNSMTAHENIMKLIVRSELDGLSPETYLDQNTQRAANLIARWIGSQQTDPKLPDAKLVSTVIIGALFSWVSIAPWLMTSVGLPPESFDKRKDDIMDVLIWIITRAIGQPTDAEKQS